MDFGVGYFPTHDAMGPGPVARLVEDCAETLEVHSASLAESRATRKGVHMVREAIVGTTVRGPYSPAVVAEGRFVFVAGQGPLTNGQYVPGSIEEETTLTLENLGAVLEQFFGRLASMNTFTELVLVSESRGEIKRWPPRMATRQLV